MMGFLSFYIVGVVKIGNLVRVVLGDMFKYIEICYYEFFVKMY